MVQACPECDHSNIQRRKSQRPLWHCSECGADFDEPTEREAINTGSDPRTWHAQALIEADPDIIQSRRKA